ncbi:MAG: ABC transporter permease [Clostridia bacterium]|nr:ABC transporter permease [Clostridia bacterium]
MLTHYLKNGKNRRKLPIVFLISIMLLFGNASCESVFDNKAALDDLPAYSFTWRMAERLDDSLYDEYRHDDGQRFQNLLLFLEKLRSLGELTFTPYTTNPVELLNLTIPEQCMVNYGTEFAGESAYEIEGEPAVAAEAVQVTENFFDLFPMQITEGRGFTDEDYDFLGKGTIPIIMGAAYKGTFSLSDRFEGHYIFDRFTFEVIGFAESGGAFYSSGDGGPELYDRYIIMPFASISEDSETGRIILLQQICGLITDENGRDDALKQVNEYLADSGLGDWIGQFYITDVSLRTIIGPFLK